MKRFVAVSAAVLMMCSSVMAGEINVKLNGEAVEFSSQEPVVIEGRTLIPLRGVFEKLGYEIEWDNETKTAVFKKADTEVKVTVNADSFDVNGEKVSLDVPAQIVNGSMMLPLRAVGEATGLEVDWDSESKTVSLKSQAETKTEKVTESITENGTESKTEDVTEKDSKSSGEKTKTDVKNINEAEDKAFAKEYIEYNMASALCAAYISVETNMEANFHAVKSQEELNIVLELAIEFENMFLKKVNALDVNEYNRDLISDLKNTIEVFIKDRTFFLDVNNMSVVTDEKRVSLELKEAMKEYSDKMIALSDKFDESLENYYEVIKASDWDFDQLTESEAKEERAYQKKVGDILEKALDFGKNTDKKTIYKNIKSATATIRSEVGKLTPPDFASKDDDVLFAGCDVLDKAADVYSRINDGDVEKIYVTVLISVFDAAAKSCAGDYYVSVFSNIEE